MRMSYKDVYGFTVDASHWEADYEAVIGDLAAQVMEATGVSLRWHINDSRGGVYYHTDTDEYFIKQRIEFILHPNYIPVDDEWHKERHKQFAVLLEAVTPTLQQLDAYKAAIIGANGMQATLIQRTEKDIDRKKGPPDILFSLDDEGSPAAD